MPFQIIRNDITKIKADAIVNTANPDAAVGGGADSSIYKAAGEYRLPEAEKKIGLLSTGNAVVTAAYDLDAKYIIHVSCPLWADGSKGEAEFLRLCYDTALQLANEYGCKSIAFPLLATGSFGFPKELGIQIAVDAFTSFLEDNDIEITLAVPGSEDVSISGSLVEKVAEFIDDYVAVDVLEEYDGDGYQYEPKNRSESEGSSLSGYISIPPFFSKNKKEKRGKSLNALEAEIKEAELPVSEMMFPCSEVKSLSAPQTSFLRKAPFNVEESLEASLKEIYKESFEKYLQQLINRKGLKNSEVYAAANISKQYFSKLLKGQVKPSKEKMLALAVGLRLNRDETVDFLRIAGYAISPVSQTDRIVEYFIEHEDYNVMKIDIVLFDYGLAPLSNQ